MEKAKNDKYVMLYPNELLWYRATVGLKENGSSVDALKCIEGNIK